MLFDITTLLQIALTLTVAFILSRYLTPLDAALLHAFANNPAARDSLLSLLGDIDQCSLCDAIANVSGLSVSSQRIQRIRARRPAPYADFHSALARIDVPSSDETDARDVLLFIRGSHYSGR